MSDDHIPADSKLTTSKRRWAAEGKFLTGRISRPENERLPPGQHLVKNWPVLDLGEQPQISLSSWRGSMFSVSSKSGSAWIGRLSRPSGKALGSVIFIA